MSEHNKEVCEDCPGVGEDGCCREEYVVESHDLQPEQNYIAESYVHEGITLDMVLRDVFGDISTLMEAVNELRDEFDHFASKHAS